MFFESNSTNSKAFFASHSSIYTICNRYPIFQKIIDTGITEPESDPQSVADAIKEFTNSEIVELHKACAGLRYHNIFINWIPLLPQERLDNFLSEKAQDIITILPCYYKGELTKKLLGKYGSINTQDINHNNIYRTIIALFKDNIYNNINKEIENIIQNFDQGSQCFWREVLETKSQGLSYEQLALRNIASLAEIPIDSIINVEDFISKLRVECTVSRPRVDFIVALLQICQSQNTKLPIKFLHALEYEDWDFDPMIDKLPSVMDVIAPENTDSNLHPIIKGLLSKSYAASDIAKIQEFANKLIPYLSKVIGQSPIISFVLDHASNHEGKIVIGNKYVNGEPSNIRGNTIIDTLKIYIHDLKLTKPIDDITTLVHESMHTLIINHFKNNALPYGSENQSDGALIRAAISEELEKENAIYSWSYIETWRESNISSMQKFYCLYNNEIRSWLQSMVLLYNDNQLVQEVFPWFIRQIAGHILQDHSPYKEVSYEFASFLWKYMMSFTLNDQNIEIPEFCYSDYNLSELNTENFTNDTEITLGAIKLIKEKRLTIEMLQDEVGQLAFQALHESAAPEYIDKFFQDINILKENIAKIILLSSNQSYLVDKLFTLEPETFNSIFAQKDVIEILEDKCSLFVQKLRTKKYILMQNEEGQEVIEKYCIKLKDYDQEEHKNDDIRKEYVDEGCEETKESDPSNFPLNPLNPLNDLVDPPLSGQNYEAGPVGQDECII
ncbi:MAG: hypothetical protein SFT68_05810 [Rickettsiaceae bacterium]|nr:hypothetical protein [Rickettsiaceae bacterium]